MVVQVHKYIYTGTQAEMKSLEAFIESIVDLTTSARATLKLIVL